VGVKRVGALPATCTIQFTLPANPSGVTVPEGTRIRSIDGRVVFVTDEDLNIAEDVLTSTVTATCEVDGEEGNGYLMNQVNTIVDPLPFIATANNLQTTAGGSAQESDANLRERIRLAPSSFSNAGSSGAYKFFAKTANPNIVDVFVTSTVPGTVTIYPLMADGEETPEQVITAVEEACNDEKVRPLTDTVEVISPTKEEYVLNIELTLYEEADQASIEELVLANLEAYTLSKRTALGQDVVLSQIQKQCMVDGVYDVVVKDGDDDPFVTLVIDAESFAFCTEINIQTVGTNVG
jgi:phage-related baseplate assembly protein